MLFYLLYRIISRNYNYKTVKIGKERIKLYLADTPMKKTLGLMYWKRLMNNEGMLFVFDKEDRHPFWTLNMEFSIDIIWLDKRKKIVDITEDARPSRSIFNFKKHLPEIDAKYVIEIISGNVKKLGIKKGSYVVI